MINCYVFKLKNPAISNETTQSANLIDLESKHGDESQHSEASSGSETKEKVIMN